MHVATFNVENFFSRVRALNADTQTNKHPREIDIGIFSRREIRSLRTHDEDRIGAYEIFFRDCAEYKIILHTGKSLWMLCNHFKSSGYGKPASNDAKRLKQSTRVRDILKRFDLNKDLMIVAGDFNELSDSASLALLLKQSTNLRSAFEKPPADADQWTHLDDVAKNKQIDYLLLSASLFNACHKVGIERRGIFSKTNSGGKYRTSTRSNPKPRKPPITPPSGPILPCEA